MSERHPALADPLKHIELLHKEVQFEHQLIAGRLSALLAGQPFLLAAFAVSARWEARHHQHLIWFYGIIPVVGFIVAFLALLAVLEGERRLRILRKRLYESDPELAELADKVCPRLDPLGQSRNLFYAVALPTVFTFAWIYVAAVTVWLIAHGDT